ncbi:hypothetical protein Q4574_14250 [Aliiglaciecola sp. 3_MG-2023]|uniref:hypothetical protein n=1 Tax=Aliiglaciecola sp. 3_MG-2023 TaxID=3062644 RepID=UPI0026E13398|nr:hypothetical protein [Aliiglaciecola sp. 3_MG-2023]MDO6694453.1 hypothetical protein [Aliiglaciecola sp. 3_MG-2023]
MSDPFPWQGENRRKTPRSHDKFYQIVLGLNIVAWVIFVASLIVFHYARPELISGVQEYWGVTGREDWSMSLSIYLILLLGLCTFMSLFVLFMRRYRTRRRNDYFGINVIILLAISVVVLVWILSDL